MCSWRLRLGMVPRPIQLRSYLYYSHKINLYSLLVSSDTADYEVRLVDGNYPGDGYVQTRCPNSTWSTVCDNHIWDIREAQVTCKQLGLSWAYGTEANGGPLTTDTGEVTVNNVLCTGYEEVLGDCTLTDIDSACFTSNAPGVECGECE